MTDKKAESKQKRVALPLFGIPRILPFAKPYKKQFVGLVTAQILCSVSDVLRPVLQKTFEMHLKPNLTVTHLTYRKPPN